jgi:2-hydroxymuconate-semialdehyde hydrolase
MTFGSHGQDHHRNGAGARERMLAGLPLVERRPPLAGASTALLEGGDGPPLILLPGAIECGGAYWAPVIPQLTERYRVIVPDLPGLGASAPLPRLDAPSFAAWLDALIRVTCQEAPILVAHSLGGSLSAGFAVDHGRLLRRLVIYGTPAIGRYRMPLALRVAAVRFMLRPTERNAERFDRLAFLDFDRVRAADPGWFKAFSAYSRERARVRHVKRTMARLIKDGTAELAETKLRWIATPTTLVWGSHDRFVPLAVGEDASARLGWPLHVIERSGHAPHIERPGAFVNAIEREPDRFEVPA